MQYWIDKASSAYLSKYLEEIENPLMQSKIQSLFKYSTFMGIVLCICSFLLHDFFSLPFNITCFAGFSCLSIPVILKHKKSYATGLKVLSVILLFSTFSVQHIANPNLIVYSFWYTGIILAASFYINHRWGFSIAMLILINMIFTIYFEETGVEYFSAQHFIQTVLENREVIIPNIIRVTIFMYTFFFLINHHVNNENKTRKRILDLLKEQSILNQKLQEKDAMYNLLINEADDMIYEFNSQGFFSYINPSLEKLTGYHLRNNAKIAFNQPILKEYAKEHTAFFNQQAKDKKQVSYREIPILSSTGKIVWLGQKANMFFDEEGNLIRTLCIGRDITLQKKTKETLIEAKEQAEEASKIKAQFLSSMSHEIRTPMNAVIGLIHLLLEENPHPSQLDHLKTLKFSAENLLALINNILDFSKIEAGKIELKQMDLNLQHIIKNIHHGFSSKAWEKGIGLALVYDSRIPKILMGDPLRISQIINNLVNNAIKFTDEGGVVVNIIQEKEYADSLDVYFSVQDSGIGIPEDKLKIIFNDFEQVNNDTIRQGSGLGLAITKELVALQNSEIKVNSIMGKGSEFSFILNFKKSRQNVTKPLMKKTSSIPTTTKTNSLKGVRLLLVEDNLINQKVATNFLNKWGITTDIANNGQIALDFVQKQDYDLILMDLQMPVMNGIEATKKIRALGGTYTHLPIIALTASAITEIKDNTLQAGMNDFISKPFLPDNLYDRIKQHLKKEIRVLASAVS